MSIASPDESVTDEPVIAPSEFFNTTFAPETAEVSASTETSIWRIRFRIPVPVTSTLVVSIVPSTKSTTAEPVITTSFPLPKSLSTKVILPEPAVSIPTAFVVRSMPDHVMSLLVALPN